MDKEDEESHLHLPLVSNYLTHLQPFPPPPPPPPPPPVDVAPAVWTRSTAPMFWDQSVEGSGRREAVLVEQVQIERRTYSFPQLHRPTGVEGAWSSEPLNYFHTNQNFPHSNNYSSTTWIYPRRELESHANAFRVHNNGISIGGSQVLASDPAKVTDSLPQENLCVSPVMVSAVGSDKHTDPTSSSPLEALFLISRQKTPQQTQTEPDGKDVQAISKNSNQLEASSLANIRRPIQQMCKNSSVSAIIPFGMDMHLLQDQAFQVLPLWEQHLLEPTPCPSLAPGPSHSKYINGEQSLKFFPGPADDKEIEKRGWLMILQKELRNSDVSNLGRIVLPKKEAERNLPPLLEKDGVILQVVDMEIPVLWAFKYRFWPNNKSRMYIMENTGDFVKAHNLKTGDFFILYRDRISGNYIARAKKADRSSESSLQPTE